MSGTLPAFVSGGSLRTTTKCLLCVFPVPTVPVFVPYLAPGMAFFRLGVLFNAPYT